MHRQKKSPVSYDMWAVIIIIAKTTAVHTFNMEKNQSNYMHLIACESQISRRKNIYNSIIFASSRCARQCTIIICSCTVINCRSSDGFNLPLIKIYTNTCEFGHLLWILILFYSMSSGNICWLSGTVCLEMISSW
jgi:hypothetical protein